MRPVFIGQSVISRRGVRGHIHSRYTVGISSFVSTLRALRSRALCTLTSNGRIEMNSVFVIGPGLNIIGRGSGRKGR